VALLFRVGIESEPVGLARQLPRAGPAWAGSILPAALLGFATTYWLLGYGVVPALFVGVAFSATSVGVSVASWREAGALATPGGQLLLDIAELDDLSGVFLMALLLALVPVLGDGAAAAWGALAGTALLLVVKFTAFGALCLAFAHLATRQLARLVSALEPEPHPALLVVGIGFAIAAVAGWIGLSLAIGALMAGLALARTPRRDEVDDVLAPLFDFFSPFFFIGIGLQIELASVGVALGLSAVLFLVAMATKIAGTAAALAGRLGWPGALTIGLSMTPRAEIALVIMEQGRRFGAVPEPLFAAVAIVSAATCLVAPIGVRRMLVRHPPADAPPR
jgi:Kef-type K+ transport system membrane component KefB